ncbi:MIP family Ig-specific serine endopeptidase [Mycoplasmopsis agassizii]|uniref:MIP family Ig-specific serine endopeptidase n=1 Tax=Mycoplasmopsis agassizii TaxID=33922 RepID=UPI0035278125
MKLKTKKIMIFSALTATLVIPSAVAVSCFNLNALDGTGYNLSTWNWDAKSERYRVMIPNPDQNSKNKLIWPISSLPLYDGTALLPQDSSKLIPDQGWYAPNANYLRNFQTSFALRFENQIYSGSERGYDPQVILGTGWILDYQKTTDGSYPLTWYIATNVHVAAALYNKNTYQEADPAFEYYQRPNPTWTRQVSLTKWNLVDEANQATPYKSEIKEDDYSLAKAYASGVVDREGVYQEGEQLLDGLPKIVYLGIDYLEDSPTNWNQNLKEELIDFAVLEVKFKNEEIAKEATSNYATWSDKDQANFLDKDYLTKTNENKNLDLKDNFYMAGFPNGKPRINQEKIGETNSNLSAYNPQWSQAELDEAIKKYDLGDSFNENRAYSAFELDSQKGIGDILLNLPYLQLDYRDNLYTTWALTYSFSRSGLSGGSSGSKITNKDNQIVGIHSLGSSSAESNTAFALKSDGHAHDNYNGYVTPAYDIIYGGVQGQKTSYKSTMEKIFKGKNIETDLLGKIA